MASRPAVVVEPAMRSPTASIAFSVNVEFQKKLFIIQEARISFILCGIVWSLFNAPAAALSMTSHRSALGQ